MNKLPLKLKSPNLALLASKLFTVSISFVNLYGYSRTGRGREDQCAL